MPKGCLSVFRNLTSTLTIVSTKSRLTADDVMRLPLRVRPPGFRPDHWVAVVRFNNIPSEFKAQQLRDLLLEHRDRAGTPRDHLTRDPVQTTVTAAAEALRDIDEQEIARARASATATPDAKAPTKLRGNLWGESKVVAQWERLELADSVREQQLLWPRWMVHENMREQTHLSRWSKRVKNVWEQEALRLEQQELQQHLDARSQ
ncbi:hypothetical protein RI367_007042 [Sorochytrium milnesiophthora]